MDRARVCGWVFAGAVPLAAWCHRVPTCSWRGTHAVTERTGYSGLALMHRVDEYARRGKEPTEDELQIYTWYDEGPWSHIRARVQLSAGCDYDRGRCVR